MSRGEAWCVHAAALLVGGTGVVYGWMRYFAEPLDELALVNHPLQPLLQALHVLFAPLLVFACGLVWRDHVWRRLRSRESERRLTGHGLLWLLFPMLLSGYLVQVTSGGLRSSSIAVHVASSSVWTLGYLAHQLARRRGAAQVRSGKTAPVSESAAASRRSA